MYKEKTGHRKEDKEGIPAQRKSNGTEEELLKPGKGKSVETKDANRLGTYWPIDGQALMLVMDYIQGMSKKKTIKPSFKFETIARQLNRVTSNTGRGKSSDASHQKKYSKKQKF